MPKEITNKTKKDIYYKCTHSSLSIYVDGCEDYVRVGGNEGDYEVVHK